MLQNIKRAYYYLFYKLYKFWESASDPKFWSDRKASVTIVVMEIWILISCFIYYTIFFNRYFHVNIKHPVVIISGIIVFLINYLAFAHTDKWREYVKEFEQLPKRKNKIGNWIVLGLVLLIVSNVIFSFYLMSRIDWSWYR